VGDIRTGRTLLFSALAVVGAALYAAGQKEKPSLRGGRTADGKIRLTIIEPALVLNGTARYSDLEQWLNYPLKPGTRRSGFPVRGQVTPPPGRGQIRIRIFTDKWYNQDEFLIESGNFSGLVYINAQRPRTRFELTVVNSEGMDLLKSYADLI